MDNVEDVLQALFIGIALASVLLQTCRYSKAIELFGECLVFLKENSSKIKEENLNRFYLLVYYRLFYLYRLVSDYKNAFHNGEKASLLYQQTGELESAAGLLEEIGDLYQVAGDQANAKERYEKALTYYSKDVTMPVVKRKEHLNRRLVLITKIGDKESEGWLLNQLGELSLSSFEYSKAKEYFEKELTIWKETGNRKEEGWALRCLGNLYLTTEEYQHAKQYYEEAMILLEEMGEMKKLGDVFSELGRVCGFLRQFQQVKILQKKALEISVRSGNKDDEKSDYRHLAIAHSSLGEYEEAKKCYQKALTISRKLNHRKGEALTYSDLGLFYCGRKDFKMAEKYCKKAREMYKETGDLPNEASEERKLGGIYLLLGEYQEAEKCYERSLVINKQIGDSIGEGDSYCDLGVLYQSIGDYGKAKECHEEALAISKEANHLRGQGVDYGNLGSVYQYLGDYDKAYEYHKKALEFRLQTDDREALPAAYNNLGNVYQHLGEYFKANKCFKKALRTAKEIGDRRIEATILSNLASTEVNVGEHEQAVAYNKEALQISKEVRDIKLEAGTNGSLGAVYIALGDPTTAKKYLEKSRNILKRIGCKGKESVVLGNLGKLFTSLGEYAKARKCYEQALEISSQTNDKKVEMAVNNNLGSLHLSQDEFKNALDCFEKALGICEQMGDLHGKSVSYCNIAMVFMMWDDFPKALSYLSAGIKSLEEMRLLIGESEYYKIGFAEQNADPYQLMVRVLFKLGCTNEALSISELARARSLAELMATQYSCQQLPCFDPNRWIDFTNFIQTKSYTCLSFCFLHENLLCWIIKASRVEIVTNKSLKVDIRPQGGSVQDWLEALANECNRTFSISQKERCEDRSLFLWDENSEARSPLKFEEGLPTSQAPKKKGNDEKKPVALRDLYKLIITPVQTFMTGTEIIIVPDRSLYIIPFAALIDESGEYLSEKFRIRFIPSLTTLKLIQDSPANYHSQTGVLIVGDPEVGLTGLDPLPFARKEAEMIGRMLRVHPLTGKQATKHAVIQKIHSVSLIHIAAHGNADRGDIALAPAQNLNGEPQKEDFVLTMSDISKVQLRAKLVVLSCCHSARGQIKAEGVVGIARAFLGSGARSVLVSLWAVDDIATMQFMNQFYGNLVCGKSAGQSLHETMKWMRGNPEYSEVRKWAPFMLIGDDVSFEFGK